MWVHFYFRSVNRCWSVEVYEVQTCWKILIKFWLGIQIKFENYINGYQRKQLEQLDCSVLEIKSIPSTSTQHFVSSNYSTKNLPENCFDLNQILTRSTQVHWLWTIILNTNIWMNHVVLYLLKLSLIIWLREIRQWLSIYPTI